MEHEDVRAAAFPIKVERAWGDVGLGAGDTQLPEKPGAFLAIGPRGDESAGHRQHFLVAVFVGGVDAGHRRRQKGDGLQLQPAQAEITLVGFEVEPAVEALVEEQALGLFLGIGDARADGLEFAGRGVHGDEVGLHHLDHGGEAAVVTGERIEVFVHGIDTAEPAKFTRGGIVTREAAAGIGADPEAAVGRFGDAGGEDRLVAVDRAEVFQPAFGMGGIVAKQVTVGVRADVEDAGGRAAEGGGGILL